MAKRRTTTLEGPLDNDSVVLIRPWPGSGPPRRTGPTLPGARLSSMTGGEPPVDERRLDEWEQELLSADRPRALHQWEWELVRDGRQFSHERYSANFMAVATDVVSEFAEWLSRRAAEEGLSRPPVG